jgi:hypothetical protein
VSFMLSLPWWWVSLAFHYLKNVLMKIVKWAVVL